MAQLSKQTLQLEKKSLESQNVFDTYGEQIAEAVEKIKAQEIGTPLPEDIKQSLTYLYLQHMSKVTTLRLENLKLSDAKVFSEEREDNQAIENEDAAMKQTRHGTIRLKDSLAGTYSPKLPKDIGLAGEIPQDPLALLQLLSNVNTIICKDDFALPTPLDEYSPCWNKDALINRLTKLQKPLQDAVNHNKTEKKETQQARIVRRENLRQLRLAITAFNSSMETLARLAGLDEVADRIRPTIRKTSTGSPETNTDPTPTPAES